MDLKIDGIAIGELINFELLQIRHKPQTKASRLRFHLNYFSFRFQRDHVRVLVLIIISRYVATDLIITTPATIHLNYSVRAILHFYFLFILPVVNRFQNFKLLCLSFHHYSCKLQRKICCDEALTLLIIAHVRAFQSSILVSD